MGVFILSTLYMLDHSWWKRENTENYVVLNSKVRQDDFCVQNSLGGPETWLSDISAPLFPNPI